MIRYTTVRQPEEQEGRSLQKNSSLEKGIVLSRTELVLPQQSSNSSTALKDLKKVNDLREMMKGRLSVLQIQQEKNQNRAQKNEQKYHFYQQMRDEMSKEREEKALHLKNILNKIQQTQEQAKNNRKTHQQNLRKAQNQLNTSRSNDYRTTKEQREEIEKSLSNFRQDESDRKKQRKRDISEYERFQRKSVVDYIKNKQIELKVNDSLQSARINQVKLQKTKQIEGLSKLQEMMIERQSRSRMSSEASEMKLKKLLTNGKSVSTSHTTKLPSIGQGRTENNQPDILII